MNKHPIYTIEVNNIFYVYSVGLTYIAIASKPDGQWGELPEHFRVCFAIDNPGYEVTNNPINPGGEIEALVRAVIKGKIEEQKQTKKAPRNLPGPRPRRKKIKLPDLLKEGSE
jgi:hypothetical protein